MRAIWLGCRVLVLLAFMSAASWAQCPDTSSSWSGTRWRLDYSPSPGQAIRITYERKTPRPVRLVLFRDGTWFANIQSPVLQIGQPQTGQQYIDWPGGQISYIFEICSQNSWKHLNPHNPKWGLVPGGASYRLQPTDTSNSNFSSLVYVDWGGNIPSLAGQFSRTFDVPPARCHPNCDDNPLEGDMYPFPIIFNAGANASGYLGISNIRVDCAGNGCQFDLVVLSGMFYNYDPQNPSQQRAMQCAPPILFAMKRFPITAAGTRSSPFTVVYGCVYSRSERVQVTVTADQYQWY